MVRALRYSLDEALLSLWRGRRSGALSTLTIAVALFVLGAFLIVTRNLDALAAEWGRAAEMSVYLADAITPAERTAVEAMLAPGSVVEARAYVSKADGLARFKQTFTDLAASVDGLGDNPIPASFDVRLRSTQEAQAALDGLAARLRQAPGVADVRYDRQWLDRLASSVRIVGAVGFGLGALLTLAAALTIANVVRLALFARRDEIEIMELVGAPGLFVRGPFIVEGVLQGGLGALLALLLLAALFFAIRAPLLMPLAAAINLSSIAFLSPPLGIGLVLGGMAVGCLGGLVAAAGRV
ncbi:MAG: ABC transporter permease [Acidobacteria bacterium]|nr:ABC transporter permease [Acidobacteriota bacterium]